MKRSTLGIWLVVVVLAVLGLLLVRSRSSGVGDPGKSLQVPVRLDSPEPDPTDAARAVELPRAEGEREAHPVAVREPASGSGAFVSGVVKERSGAVVVGARCSLARGQPASPFAGAGAEAEPPAREHALTDASGAFRLGAGPGFWRLCVERPGFARYERDHLVAGDELEVRLDPEARLLLTVVAADGAPVPEAELAVRAADEAELPPRARTRTDPAGRAVVLGLAPGTWLVTARCAGFGVSDTRLTIPAGVFALERTLTLERATRLAGTVRSTSGAPIAGARVRIESPNRHAPLVEEAVSDADGRYATERIFTVRETLEIVAAAEGFAEAWRFFALRPEHEGRAEVRLDLELEDAALSVTGRALSGGAGLAGVAVRIAALEPVGNSPQGVIEALQAAPARAWMWQEAARTDVAGRFEVAGLSPAPQYVLVLERADLAPRVVWVPRAAGVRIELGDLELERCGSLFGVARYEDGVPAEGVELALYQRNEVRVEAQGELSLWRPSAWFKPFELRTREGGAFRADHLDPGTYEFLDSAQRWSVEAGRATGPVELVLQRPQPEEETTELAGVVRDRAGRALELVFVRAFAGDASGEERLLTSALADARGRFALRVPAALPIRVALADLGGTHLGRELVLDPPLPAEPLALVLDPRPEPLPPAEGSVLSPDGAGVEDCHVTLRPPEDSLCACLAFHARTDRDGAFHVRVSEGPHRLSAAHPRYLPAEHFPVHPGEPVVVELQEP